MGVVSQIKDLDNSSSAVPYKAHIPSTDVLHDPTPCRGSSKPLPYKFTATSIVGEGLAPPETSVKMTL